MDIHLLAAVFGALRLKEAVVPLLSSPLKGAPAHLRYIHHIDNFMNLINAACDTHSPSSQALELELQVLHMSPHPLHGARDVPHGARGAHCGVLHGALRGVLHDVLHDDLHQP